MAKPITKIVQPVPTEKERQEQTIEQLVQEVAANAEGIRETLRLLQELHESGVLGALNALVEAREKVAKIAVGQLLRPPVTNAINNLMAAAEGISQLDPEMTRKLLNSLAKGLQQAETQAENESKVGIFDLMKALKDPDINRAISFALHLLKGIGEGLKEKQ